MSLLHTPLALYTIPVAWVLLMVPQITRYTILTQHVQTARLQGAPRSAADDLTKSKAPRDQVEKAARMAGAHTNGYEVLPLYIGAVLAATYSELDNYTVNIACSVFLVSRVVYNTIYVNQSQFNPNLRTLAWLTGVFTTFYLYIASCNQLRNASVGTSPVDF